jgi:hypothetical protein
LLDFFRHTISYRRFNPQEAEYPNPKKEEVQVQENQNPDPKKREVQVQENRTIQIRKN